MKSFQKYIKGAATLATGILVSLSFPNEAAASESILYEVQPGDTLFSSARSYGKTVREVAGLNGIRNPHVIRPGQVLRIEGSANELAEVRNNLSPAGFIETVGDQAHTIAADYGLYASVMVAQAALESNYGRSTLASPPNYNLFGIKGAQGDETVVMSTTEFENGQWTSPNELFKKYPNYGASMADNAWLLRHGNSWAPNYYAGAWVENTNNYTDATESLEGRYATDPNYDTKLDNIIEEHELTRFDSEEAENTETPATNTVTHTVSSGDTLYNISNRYGMTVSELQQLNNLNSNAIQRGETLQVKDNGLAPQDTETHTVAAGDTLYNIANRYGMSLSDLQNLNSLNSNHIELGQTLQIKNKPIATPAPVNTTTHTVAADETLYSIANQYGTTVTKLQQLNQLNSSEIQAGQTLTVSGSITHTVAPGDTLYNISNRYDLTVEELKAKNNLTSNAITIGQDLQI